MRAADHAREQLTHWMRASWARAGRRTTTVSASAITSSTRDLCSGERNAEPAHNDIAALHDESRKAQLLSV